MRKQNLKNLDLDVQEEFFVFQLLSPFFKNSESLSFSVQYLQHCLVLSLYNG